MDCFDKLEALIESGSADAVEQARALLCQVTANSKAAARAVDEFLIDLMTLVFLVESGRDALQNSARRLARARLSKLKLLYPPEGT
ncbi:hypothetical protein QV13_07605 [Mesorhizobium hungaricum]|uniref:Uncharacterized protein n=1 Tax=Mesorhizobium hungaricum TaxID=1566387 RepID=A0A1C2E3C9_9HYPH|nr:MULTISPECIES: hypothetical protein [Mesorhizobium]MBN9235851.1 hypothetical protein [Mesorhizobium sp.]MDQ0333052.1 hypothetical protein [Mesorhizobium sp. YL-MeA3-2017]OCX21510.1 hypothetical protein QV13_07605 [Mesorhizobium hungaricum]